MVTSTVERRRFVIRAVGALASRLDLKVSPRILKDSNNTIVHLAPLPLVAKVGTSHFRDASLEALDRELDVARHLASKDAPIVIPSADPPAGPHRVEGLIVTLWRFYEDRGPLGESPSFGRLLAGIHGALLDYQGALPWFSAELDDVGQILTDRKRLTRLSNEDHAFLVRIHEELQPIALSPPGLPRPLHGSPHTGNWLNGPAGLLLLDFETACRGPVEWDLSAMGDEALDAFPHANRDLLSLLRRMRSLCVAVKCWLDPERAPEVGEAAVVHLRLLRGEPV